MTRAQRLLRDQKIRSELQRKQAVNMGLGLVMLTTLFVSPLAIAALFS
jgi:hypothetical protein